MKVLLAYSLLIFGLGLNYIFNIAIARILGPHDYGNFSYAIYYFNIFSLVAICSLDQAALRYISQTANSKDYRVAIQYLSIVCGILFSIVYFISVFLFVDDERSTLASLFGASIIPFVLLTVNVAILQAEHIVGPRMAFRYVIEPILKFFLFFLFFYYFHAGVAAPVLAFFAALTATHFAAVLSFRHRLGFISLRPIKDRVITIFKFSAPLAIGNAVTVLSGRLDLIILGALVSASDLGNYSAAVQTAAIIIIVLQGIETVYAPIFSEHIGLLNYSTLKDDYQRALRWAVLISSPVILIFIVYPDLVMLPFGAKYQGASTILAVLCVGQFLILAMGSANAILMMLGKSKLVLYISLISVVLTAVFVTAGAHYKGVIGAAIGVVVAIALTNMVRVFFTFQLTGCHPFSKSYLKMLASLLLTVIAGFLTKSYLLNVGVVLYPLLFIVFVVTFGMHMEDKLTILNLSKKFLKVNLKRN